jgi:hypothetical protein
MNKIDLSAAAPEKVLAEMKESFDMTPSDILMV